MAPIALARVPDVDARVALIQALIPVGLAAFHEELQASRSARGEAVHIPP